MTDPPDHPPPNPVLPKNEDAPSPDVEPVKGRRVSAGTRRSRRKKDDVPDEQQQQQQAPSDEKKTQKRGNTNSNTSTATANTRRQRDTTKNSTNTSSSRKKPKLDNPPSPQPTLQQPQPQQPQQEQQQPQPPPKQQQQQQQQQQHLQHHASSVPAYTNPSPLPSSYSLAPPPVPPRTSGQNYDPIRSALDTSSPAPTPSNAASPPSRSAFRASASPAIASIIDPPSTTTSQQPVYSSLSRASPGHVAPSSTLSSPAGHPRAPSSSHHSLAPSPLPAASSPSHSHGAVLTSHNSLPPGLQPPSSSHSYAHQSPYPASQQSQSQQLRYEEQKPDPMQLSQALAQPQQPSPPQPSQEPVAMEVDQPDSGAQSSTTKTAKKDNDKEKDKDKDKDKEKNTAPPSKAPSPKPARNAKEKDAVPTKLPQGSGLISNALFGMDDNADTEDAQHATPNIILHIPLNSVNNRIVNFARLAEEQYGFAALHPRLAAHKERLARVAAAGAALERNEKSAKGLLSVAGGGESADEDLSLDMDRDSDLDGDIAMAGIGAAANDAPADGTDGKKKRRKKMEEYDRDDPFVDDSEMAWQEHAAASKDGYFVYSGPLVPEGEKVQVERADGTVKRGRGRGRGGRSRAPPSGHQVPLAAASTSVPISQETGLPLRGPGSRGGSTTRRPRVSKAARQQMEMDGNKEKDKLGNHTSTGSQGRGGGAAGRGGGSGSRGGKTPSSSPSTTTAATTATANNENTGATDLTSRPSLAPAPPGPSPLSGPELVMK